MGRKGFYNRGFTSLVVVASFLIMTITGIVLYLAPHGRVAYWVTWSFLGLTKTDWANIHIVSSIAFALAAGFHIYFNWKLIVDYVAGKLAGALKHGKELALTGFISVLLIAGSIYLIPPFNYIIEFGEYLKGIWVVSRDYEPPFGHAEEVSLRTFTKKTDIDLVKAMNELLARGIIVHSEKEKLIEIARNNNIVPMDIYVIIKKYVVPPLREGVRFTPEMVEEKFSGTGIGRKPLSWMIEELGIDRALAMERLKVNHIIVSDAETMKQIAEKHGVEPIEVLKVILVEGYAP